MDAFPVIVPDISVVRSRLFWSHTPLVKVPALPFAWKLARAVQREPSPSKNPSNLQT
jgi:hypothetical protein